MTEIERMIQDAEAHKAEDEQEKRVGRCEKFKAGRSGFHPGPKKFFLNDLGADSFGLPPGEGAEY